MGNMVRKHILLLGATGLSGIEFIKLVLEQTDPPFLTLFVRAGSKSKLPATSQNVENIRTVEGALNDISAVKKALSPSTDGTFPTVTDVISFLGAYITLGPIFTRDKSRPIANAFESAVLPAMKEQNVTRILALSTPSALHTPQEAKSMSWKWWFYTRIPPLLAPQGNAEMLGIANAIIAAGSKDRELEWTVFRVPHLTSGDTTAQVVTGQLDDRFEGSFDLSRGSLARWALEELDENAWIRGTPLLANK